MHIFERYSALQTVSYEQENFPSVYCKQNNNGQWLKRRVFFLWLHLGPSLKGMEFVFVYTRGESHTMHNSIISHDSEKKENSIKTKNLKSMQIFKWKRRS